MNLSTQPIPPSERLIFALDVPSRGEAMAWVERLGDAVTFYKLGLEFCMSGDYFAVLPELRERGKKIFADLKFSDVPATVRGAVAALARHNADFCTLHGTSSVYREAVLERGAMKLLAVTVLTSVDDDEVKEMGWSGTVEDLVVQRAKRAVECGIDGLICSPLEVARVRQEVGPAPLLITPGIRAADEAGTDDQKRTLSLEEAFQAGSDYVVVGRPIRKAADPRAKAQEMQAQIARVFSASK